MALSRSTIFSELRGSINGTVFSRNRYGAYARNRTNPVNPNTVSQQVARAALANTAQQWRELTDGERLLWKNYADASPVTNRLGESIILSPIAMFNKLNGFRTFVGDARETSPPILTGMAESIAVTGITIADDGSAAPNTLKVDAYEMGSASADARYAAWISAPQSVAKTFHNGPWTYLGVKTGVTRLATYAIPWLVTADQNFFVRLRYMDAEGRLGPDHIEPILAVTVP